MDPNANTLGILTDHIAQIACPECGAGLDVSEFGVFEDIVCPACQATIKVPGRLGNFILLEELGRGAMGCVYLAQDEQLGRHVALKVMRREYGDDPKMLETLQREAQAMATLNHRNVVSVYSFGRENGQPYFVMELLQGERLDAMMANGGIVDEVRLLEIALDVAGGLEAAASADLTHGDIKPANILMNEKGVAKVVDFGLARFMDPDAEIEVWGTPYYIAPEKARKKGEDSRSDQYSLGATMFHALAGHPPFDGENPTKVVLAALKEETPNLQEHNPEIGARTAAVIRRMMDKTPSRRYPTYASLAADIQRALEEARATAKVRREQELLASAAKTKKKNSLLQLMSIVAAVILGAVLVGGFLATRGDRQAMAVVYDGPSRSLHEPLITVEVRNLREAADNLRRGDMAAVERNLNFARRNIPSNHAALAWYHFFVAGLHLYAQQSESARSLLQAAADQSPIVFDGGRVPAEDPRLLARIALGQASDRDVNRALRNAQPYFAHLVELANGFQLLLQNRSNDAARHFRAYSEFRAPPGITFPYVLQPLAPTFHLSRSPMQFGGAAGQPPAAAATTPASTPATGAGPAAPPPRPATTGQDTSELAGIGIRDSRERPIFRVANLDAQRRLPQQGGSDPRWTSQIGAQMVLLTDTNALIQASGLEFRPGRRFSLSAILRTSPEAQGETALISGTSQIRLANGQPLPTGYLLSRNGPILHLRIGDGQQILFQTQFEIPRPLQNHTALLVTLDWEGWTDRQQAPNRIRVSINDQLVQESVLNASQLPPMLENPRVFFGAALTAEGAPLPLPGAPVEVLRAMVFDRVVPIPTLYSEYSRRIADLRR